MDTDQKEPLFCAKFEDVLENVLTRPGFWHLTHGFNKRLSQVLSLMDIPYEASGQGKWFRVPKNDGQN